MQPRHWFPKHYADEVQRLRVPMGFLMVAAFAWYAEPTRASLSLGMPVCVLGLAVRGWASGHLAKNETLTVSGPYSYVRNPLYIGTLLTAAGVVIASRQTGLAFLFGLVFTLVYLPSIELEEQHLRKLFPAYEDYAMQVPSLLPRWPGLESPERFRWEVYVRNREYRALLGFAAGVVFLAWRAGLILP
jgi:protein-S-isoprenylcysteine O-methyltransferase Ste14